MAAWVGRSTLESVVGNSSQGLFFVLQMPFALNMFFNDQSIKGRHERNSKELVAGFQFGRYEYRGEKNDKAWDGVSFRGEFLFLVHVAHLFLVLNLNCEEQFEQ
jgi:hypothetical protein